jgi:hypothetical protein
VTGNFDILKILKFFLKLLVSDNAITSAEIHNCAKAIAASSFFYIHDLKIVATLRFQKKPMKQLQPTVLFEVFTFDVS